MTLQEFFTASELRERAGELMGYFEADVDAWRETVKLWCGLAGDSTELIRSVYTLKPLVAFECLADAQELDQTLADEIVEAFQQKLGIEENEAAITTAFGVVAANDQPRGQNIFHFLTDVLEQNQFLQRYAASIAG
ncbi:MAG: hypothetical protein WBA10_09090 [Elainellaceae cyanobacterium]